MATTQLQDCAVCDKKTSQRCSGCRSVFFCGEGCQRLGWSTHKWLCKLPPDSFSFPPLDVASLDTFRRDVMEDLTATTPLWYLGYRGLYHGDLETLLYLLSSDPSPPGFDEPRRSYILAFGYTSSLSNSPDDIEAALAAKLGRTPPSPFLPTNPWVLTAVDIEALQQMTDNRREPFPPIENVWDLGAPFYRQLALLHSLLAQAVAKNPRRPPVDLALVELARKRLRDTIPAVRLSEQKKRDMMEFVEAIAPVSTDRQRFKEQRRTVVQRKPEHPPLTAQRIGEIFATAYV